MTTIKVKDLRNGQVKTLTSVAYNMLKKMGKTRHFDVLEEPKKVVKETKAKTETKSNTDLKLETIAKTRTTKSVEKLLDGETSPRIIKAGEERIIHLQSLAKKGKKKSKKK